MRAYYNEFDPFAAAWLRELIKAGQIMEGDVDERSIEEVRASDLVGYTRCHFFAGIGGWDYALRLAGWPEDRPVWTGSCPCQPFSVAGQQRGTEDARHLWPVWSRLISECRPTTVFGEQVEGAVGHGWLDVVFADLEGEGYACGAVVLPAASVGAPQLRQRLWFVADTENPNRRWKGRGKVETRRPGPIGLADSHNTEQRASSGAVCDERNNAGRRSEDGFWGHCDWLPCRDGKARPVEPGTSPLAHGIPARVGRLRGYGNAIVPQVAAEVIGAYLGC